MDIQTRKALMIEQFKKMNDEDLIDVIQNMLDYALNKDQGIPDIPEAHQKMVMERFDKIRKDPDRLVDWDVAKKRLKA